MVERLFLAVPQGCLRFVIVVVPDHTLLLFLFVVICSTIAFLTSLSINLLGTKVRLIGQYFSSLPFSLFLNIAVTLAFSKLLGFFPPKAL